jgi:hypothetical protein
LPVTKSTPSLSQEEDVSATVAAELEQGEQEQKEIIPTIPATKRKIQDLPYVPCDCITCSMDILHGFCT